MSPSRKIAAAHPYTRVPATKSPLKVLNAERIHKYTAPETTQSFHRPHRPFQTLQESFRRSILSGGISLSVIATPHLPPTSTTGI